MERTEIAKESAFYQWLSPFYIYARSEENPAYVQDFSEINMSDCEVFKSITLKYFCYWKRGWLCYEVSAFRSSMTICLFLKLISHTEAMQCALMLDLFSCKLRCVRCGNNRKSHRYYPIAAFRRSYKNSAIRTARRWKALPIQAETNACILERAENARVEDRCCQARIQFCFLLHASFVRLWACQRRMGCW